MRTILYISILTDSHPRLNHKNKKSNDTTQDMDHEGKRKMEPVYLFEARRVKRFLLSDNKFR
jgi:hypothetical protein